jgi:hypothetical protein
MAMNKTRKNIAMLLILIIWVSLFNNDVYSQIGASISFSTDKTLGLNMFYNKNKNSFYLGYSKQYNGQKNTVVRERKKTYGTTPIEDGDFYWLIDFGYSRIFLKTINLQPEFSVGNRNYFTSYEDNRFRDNGYSLINSSETIFNFGMNLGYIINDFIEPFCGYHNRKKLTVGIRIHLNLLE